MTIREGSDPEADAKSAGRSSATLVELAVDRPVAVTMIVLAVAVFGFVSFQKLSQTLLPRISYPSLTVRTEYEGAAPAEVEELITKVLESNLSVTSRLNGYRSISRAGVSDIILEFEWDTNMSFAAQDVREKVDQVRPLLPRDAEKPLLLKYDPTLDPIMRLGLYGDDLTRMRFLAEERLKEKLESLPGVAAVRVRGGFESEIRVDLNEVELRRNRVSLASIQQRLQEENVNLASGVLREGDVEYLVRTLNEFRSIEEIRKLVVARREGEDILLEDVAVVRLGAKEADVVTRINGQPSVEIAIYKEDAGNIVEVAHGVKRAVFGPFWREAMKGGELDRDEARRLAREAKARSGGDRSGDDRGGRGRRGRQGGGGPGGESIVQDDKLPALVDDLADGTHLRLLSDQSRFVERSIAEVQETGIYGAFFAILVLLLFLRRPVSTLIIAFAIPISIVATFGPMMQFDVTLNVMSLGGLALGIGMLVDASIVVLESIDRCRREGDSLRAAAIRGTREVGGAVVASVLTTVAVFLPIVFVEGVAGEIFKDQSLTVVFSLLASLVVALFFIPMLAARSFNRDLAPDERRSVGQRMGDYIGVFRARVLSHPLEVGAGASIRGYFRSTVRRGGWHRVLGIVILPLALPVFAIQILLEVIGRVLTALLLMSVAVLGLVLGLLWKLLGLIARPIAWLFDRVYGAIEAAYPWVIRGALKLRFLVVAAALMLGWLAWNQLDRIGLELVPEMHGGELIVEAPQKIGSSLETTSARTRAVEQALDGLAEKGAIETLGYSTAIGVARDELAPPGEGPHTAKIYLRLPIVPDMARAEDEATARIRDSLQDVATVGELGFSTPKLFSFQNPLEIQVKGEKLEAIEVIGRRLEARLRKEDFLRDLKSTVREGSPEYIINYDRVLLAEFGLTLNQAATAVRDKIKGVVPTKYSVPEEGRKIDVLLKIPEDRMVEIDALRNLQVNAGDQDPVRLSDVATIRQGRGPSEVRRIGGERAVFLTAAPRDSDLAAAAARIENIVAEMRAEDPTQFQGIAVRIGGQTAEAERSQTELGFALLLALILVYIVMASQFESLLDPLVIMVSSVFAGVGAVFALAWLGIAASVVVFIGGIMLAGIVVNNAIVLIDNINRLYRGGMPRREAIVSGARMRLRPILMTTLTTVLGLIPMALSTGEGAEMRVPMAVTVIAGLTSSTVLTLVIIPVVYSLAHGFTERLSGLFPGAPNSADSAAESEFGSRA
jgi:hydrophobic/amphiphilic exporter-1 (mainly G- bacteria), HAE1 family